MNRLIVMVLLSVAAVANAQTTSTKKELVARVLQLQQPAIEGIARQLAEQPAALVMQRAGAVLQQRIPPDKREAIAKDVQLALKKYVDEAVPLVRERALKLVPSTIGALLEEKFTEEELSQLIAIIESPVNRKFLQLGGEMQKALTDKLVAESRPAIEPKIRAMETAVANHLGIPLSPPPGGAASTPPAAANAAAKPPAKAASR
jgi:hypothetical protein